MHRDHGRDRPGGPERPHPAPHEAGHRLRQELSAAEDTGYFGPGSAIWRLHREAILGVGLGRALLLQLAHPWVAQATADHSVFRARPFERLVATVSAAELLVFGSRRQADAVAAPLRRLHGRISGSLPRDVGAWRAGTAYRADDPAALLWVLVTLADTTLRVYEACFGRLPDDIVRAYLADVARLGALLSIPPQMVPPDRAALRRYVATMLASGMVAVGPAAHEAAAALLRLPVPPGLSWRAYSAVTRAVAVATLPPALRDQYGPLLAVRHRRLTRVGALLGRALLPHLPARLRLDPLAAIAIQRAATLGLQPMQDMDTRASNHQRGEMSLPGLPVAARSGLSRSGESGAPRSRAGPA